MSVCACGLEENPWKPRPEANLEVLDPVSPIGGIASLRRMCSSLG